MNQKTIKQSEQEKALRRLVAMHEHATHLARQRLREWLLSNSADSHQDVDR